MIGEINPLVKPAFARIKENSPTWEREKSNQNHSVQRKTYEKGTQTICQKLQ